MEDMEGGIYKLQEEPWKVLEFYSGIGGMRYSVMNAGLNAKMVEAFDINELANDVYQHNFGHFPHQAKRKPLSFRNPVPNKQLLWAPGPSFWHNESTITVGETDNSQDCGCEYSNMPLPIERFLEFKNFTNQELEATCNAT